jgi:hypothetical protein
MIMKNYAFALLAVICLSCGNGSSQESGSSDSSTTQQTTPPPKPAYDTALYDQLQTYLANGDTTGRWPVKHDYPVAGAVLPFNRVIAYYGNLYSNRMGALGKWPKAVMIPKLLEEVRKWNEADSLIPAIPALHYIAVTAQGSAGKDGKWRYRMPHHQIDTILNWAKEINAIVFVDIQVALSDLQTEIPLLEKYLSMPNVHLGIDPEFGMKAKGNKKPGSVIGSFDAADINWVGDYLAGLVQKHNIPPKIFMIHRFTQGMVTNTDKIRTRPELQIVMDMDGWGSPAKKRDTYRSWIYRQPVQYTGFKLFYVNDTEKSGLKELMPREAILNLMPKPIYIQYQ